MTRIVKASACLVFVMSLFFLLLLKGYVMPFGGLYLEGVVTNSLSESIPLYTESPKSKKIVGSMLPNQSLVVAYEGRSGAWVYVEYQNSVASLRDVGLPSGTMISGVVVVPNHYINKINVWWFSFVPIMVFLGLFLSSFLRRKKHNIQQAGYEKKLIDQAQILQQQNKDLAYLKRKMSNLEIIQKREMSDFVDSQKHDNQSLKVEFEGWVSGQNKKYEALLTYIQQEKEQRVRQVFESESQVRNYPVSASELSNSYDILKKEYDTLIEQMKVFNVDYRNESYEGLLKGRQFEILVARSVTYERKFKIVEWSPDKGQSSGVYTEADGYPDLLIEAPNGERYAIECKYRSKKYFRDINSAENIDWAKAYQETRYKKYAVDRSVKVLVAIGYQADASNPSTCFVVPLTKLSRLKVESKWFSRKKQRNEVDCIIDVQLIMDDRVPGNDYGAFLTNLSCKKEKASQTVKY